MNPSGRIILGALAALILWFLVREFRDGIINSATGYSFTRDDSPMRFTLTAIVHAGGVLFISIYCSGLRGGWNYPVDWLAVRSRSRALD